MAQLREFTYPSSDGVHTIHAQEWVPQGPLRGVVPKSSTELRSI